MEESPTYQVAYLATPPAPHADLTAALAMFQAAANALLTAQGYVNLMAQVSACVLPSGPNYQVSAPDPSCVLYSNLSFGMAPTPEAALAEFAARLAPAPAPLGDLIAGEIEAELRSIEAAYELAKEQAHTSYQAAWETMAAAWEKGGTGA